MLKTGSESAIGISQTGLPGIHPCSCARSFQPGLPRSLSFASYWDAYLRPAGEMRKFPKNEIPKVVCRKSQGYGAMSRALSSANDRFLDLNSKLYSPTTHPHTTPRTKLPAPNARCSLQPSRQARTDQASSVGCYTTRLFCINSLSGDWSLRRLNLKTHPI